MKDPGEMDCRKAINELYNYLDEELTVEVQASVRSHLEHCEHCFGHYEFERTFLRFLEARCRAQCAPPELKKKIFEQTLLDRDRETH
jgi:anti-sigma factor (TIGR02949 family)